MNICVFDLDNTVVMTDCLNNKAYNYALAKFNLPLFTTEKRITREIIKNFSSLPDVVLNKIIKEKQEYFIRNIRETNLNPGILSLLNKMDPTNCVLWTKADFIRSFSLLTYHNLINSFSFIFISEKKDFESDIQTICQKMHCKKEKLSFWDDNLSNIAALQACGIKNVFHVS